MHHPYVRYFGKSLKKYNFGIADNSIKYANLLFHICSYYVQSHKPMKLLSAGHICHGGQFLMLPKTGDRWFRDLKMLMPWNSFSWSHKRCEHWFAGISNITFFSGTLKCSCLQIWRYGLEWTHSHATTDQRTTGISRFRADPIYLPTENYQSWRLEFNLIMRFSHCCALHNQCR
jgi:hypothetical protein